MGNNYNESDIFNDTEFCKEYCKVLDSRASLVDTKKVITNKKLNTETMNLIERKKTKIIAKFGESGLTELIKTINSNQGTMLFSFMDNLKQL